MEGLEVGLGVNLLNSMKELLAGDAASVFLVNPIGFPMNRVWHLVALGVCVMNSSECYRRQMLAPLDH